MTPPRAFATAAIRSAGAPAQSRESTSQSIGWSPNSAAIRATLPRGPSQAP